MKSIKALVLLVLVAWLLAGCSFELAASSPTASPTVEEKRPTLTPTPTKEPEVMATETPEPALAIPSTFDITLDFVGGSCGAGSFTYTFTIAGTSLTIDQTDAGIVSTGSFDPLTGMFSTSVDVGPGSETYDGTIAFDGSTISVTGDYAWVPDSGAGCDAEISGTATP